MRTIWKAAIPLVLGAGLMLGSLTTAAAPADAFTDIRDHWAKATLTRAYDDGILKGTSATTMSPDASITKAQAVTLLCRILQVSGQGSTAGLQIPVDAWYAQDAAHGAYLGFLDGSDAGTLDLPITRGEAFRLFADAFQNVRALPDKNGLAKFKDGLSLTGETAFAAANLVDSGIVVGNGGSLLADLPLTRAEFVTMLYRFADTYSPAASYSGQAGKGVVLSGAAALENVTGNSLWFDQTASSVSLSDVTAQWAVVRSDQLSSLSLKGQGDIGTLVLAATESDTTLTVPPEFDLGTFTVGDGSGSVTVNGRPLAQVEVTGDNRTVTLNTNLETLAISGSGNTVTVNNTSGAVSKIILTGTKNTVNLNGSVENLRIEGRDNTVSGSGQVDTVDLFTRYYQVNVSNGALNPWANYDLSQVQVTLDAPTTLPAGNHLKAIARLTVPEGDQGKLCTGTWYLTGKKVQEAPVLPGSGNPVSDIEIDYTHDLQQNATLEFVLSNVNNDGETFQTKGSASLYLETFSDLGLADAAIRLVAPAKLAPGETLSVTAPISSPEAGKVCTGYWYVDGQEVASGPVTLGSGTPYLNYNFTYYYGMPAYSTVTCKVVYTTQDGRQQEISASAQVQVENYADYGSQGASMYLTSVPVLAPGETLEVKAKITSPTGKACTGTWYVDGAKVSSQKFTTGKEVPTLTHKYKYTEKMKTASEIKFVLSYTTQDGRTQEQSVSKTVTLQNYDYNYYHGPTDQEVLKMVTNAYAGNYTLAWAQNHDYSQDVKTRWVNLKGYSSKTKYLIWVNLTYQRVNIFQGSQGNWKLIRSCLCGSGKASTPTIKGVFATTYKQNAWNYGSYYCGPVVRFYGGYAFHSRLEYWPMGSGRFYDGRIGFPISHGCLRMYDDDIWFIYNNIPNGTTVVVH